MSNAASANILKRPKDKQNGLPNEPVILGIGKTNVATKIGARKTNKIGSNLVGGPYDPEQCKYSQNSPIQKVAYFATSLALRKWINQKTITKRRLFSSLLSFFSF